MKTTARHADVSQADPACGPCTAMADEFRFVAKDGGYATPWRLVPKDGIGGAMRKLTREQERGLGDGYSLQLRGPSVEKQLRERG